MKRITFAIFVLFLLVGTAAANTWQDGTRTVYNNYAKDTIIMDTFYEGSVSWLSPDMRVEHDFERVVEFKGPHKVYAPGGGTVTSGDAPIIFDTQAQPPTATVDPNVRSTTGGFQASYTAVLEFDDCALEEHEHNAQCWDDVLHCDLECHNNHKPWEHHNNKYCLQHRRDCYEEEAICGFEEHSHGEDCVRTEEVPFYFNIGWGVEKPAPEEQDPPVESPDLPPGDGEIDPPGEEEPGNNDPTPGDNKPGGGGHNHHPGCSHWPKDDPDDCKLDHCDKPWHHHDDCIKDDPEDEEEPTKDDDSDLNTDHDIDVDLGGSGGGCNSGIGLGVGFVAGFFGYGLYRLTKRKR
jgi:hypothetical protein